MIGGNGVDQWYVKIRCKYKTPTIGFTVGVFIYYLFILLFSSLGAGFLNVRSRRLEVRSMKYNNQQAPVINT